MNRRNFLHTGSLSALGLSLPTGLLSLHGIKTQNSHTWLQQLAVAVGAKRRSSMLIWSDALRTSMLQTNTELATHGFLREDTAVYFYSAQSYCFYPLVMRHAASGTTEFLVPVFGRRSDGQWKKLLVLTSFQIEALAHAATALAGQELPLQELLLPAGFAAFQGRTYGTVEGSVVTHTQLCNGRSSTDLQVLRGGKTLYTSTIQSQHCLSTAPVVGD